LALTATLGALLGYAASIAFPGGAIGPSWWVVPLTGAIAASLLSLRRVHGWHISTFVDGTLAGLLAPPLYAMLLLLRAALVSESGLTSASIAHRVLVGLYFAIFGVLVAVPCGWLAGFVYHVLLSAVERAHAKDEDPVL
jgi:hypothetical protein